MTMRVNSSEAEPKNYTCKLELIEYENKTREYIVGRVDDEVQIIQKPKRAKLKTARTKRMKYDDKN